ncbi:MAG: hypothetical protein KF684_13385 [Phycisphaeraceae bacterium]|nr:hypothetical protein [Phycisphaeraceae bacterium]
MKKVLAWVRKHLVIVILGVVAVVAFPVMFVISSGMNAKVRATVENEIRTQSRDLNALSVNYAFEPVVPGSQGFSASRAPNAATTEALRELMRRSAEQVASGREAIVRFNRNEFQPIVEGLFPRPASEQDRIEKSTRLAREWVRWNQDMLRDKGAGSPPRAEEVARRIEEKRLREESRLLGEGADASALTPEIEAEFREALVQERVRAYAAPAQNTILFYASNDALASVAPFSGAAVPPIELCWEWQWVSWTNQMVLEAIRNANLPDLVVADAPIKRVERLEIEPFPYPSQGREPVSDYTAEITRNFAESLSGRVFNPEQPNALFDIRFARVTMIVSSARLTEVLDAFARTNLITVLDLDIASVDDLGALANQGFYFGPEHVVRVAVRLETLWLRDWTREYMPPTVRAALGVAPPEGQQNEDPAAAGAPAGPGGAPGFGAPPQGRRGGRND